MVIAITKLFKSILFHGRYGSIEARPTEIVRVGQNALKRNLGLSSHIHGVPEKPHKV